MTLIIGELTIKCKSNYENALLRKGGGRPEDWDKGRHRTNNALVEYKLTLFWKIIYKKCNVILQNHVFDHYRGREQ